MENIENNTRTREREAVKTAVQTQTKPKEAGGQCPKCGADIEKGMEICPECGWKLVDYCTFCGAPMSPEDMDCPECGMPADGVMCPDCNIRNFRPFCKQCGKPLSRAARMAVEKAKKDPKVQETARLLKRIAELQAELEAADQETPQEEPEGPSEGELRLQELMAKVGFKPAEAPKPANVKKGRSREDIMAEYQKAVDDANKVMSEMLPPAGSTPQEQRNFYTARKVAVMEIVKETFYGINPRAAMGWMCNHCQILHSNPSECCYQEFGGQWMQTDTWKMWDVVDANTEGAVEVYRYVETGRKIYKRE